MTFGGLAPGEWLILWGIGSIIIIPFWRIFHKAGFPPWLSLITLLPVVNIVMLFILAFVEWPIEREINQLRKP